MIDEELVKRALYQNTCAEWVDVCKAECCKCFRLVGVRKTGTDMIIPVNLSPDRVRYYNMHDMVRYGHGNLYINKDTCFQIPEGTIVLSKCRALNKDYTCKLHDFDKPRICKGLTAEIKNKDLITPNCIYRYKIFIDTGNDLKFSPVVEQFFSSLLEV
jgi:hypothetical protein